MIPDPATIAKRRHTVRIVLRSLTALYGAWVCFVLATETLPHLISHANYLIDFGFVQDFMHFLGFFAGDVPRVLFLVALVLCERRLASWIVPVGRAENLCLNCGYSLKDLKSPICPECGTNLRT